MTAGQRSVADRHDVIEVRGGRENNLADVPLDIPKRRLRVFTGVFGSGKSSLVFGTIAAESQRLINETYPTGSSTSDLARARTVARSSSPAPPTEPVRSGDSLTAHHLCTYVGA